MIKKSIFTTALQTVGNLEPGSVIAAGWKNKHPETDKWQDLKFWGNLQMFGNSEKILRKYVENFKIGDLRTFFLYFGNNCVIENFK